MNNLDLYLLPSFYSYRENDDDDDDDDLDQHCHSS